MESEMLKGVISLSISIFFMSISSTSFAGDTGYIARSKLMQNIRLEFSVLARMSRERIEFDESLAESTRLNLLKLAASTPVIFKDDDLPINSEALPAIWENWDDFVSKSADLEFALEGVDTSTLADLIGSLGNVGATCGSCHQKYRMK
jgi:cytochrome c556